MSDDEDVSSIESEELNNWDFLTGNILKDPGIFWSANATTNASYGQIPTVEDVRKAFQIQKNYFVKIRIPNRRFRIFFNCAQ